MKEIHQTYYTESSSITKFTSILGAISLGLLLVGCEAKEQTTPKEEKVAETTKLKLSPLETEVVKMLRKEKFNRDLIFEQSKNLDLQAKLKLVNRLAGEYQIERMNMLKARVQMGTIDHQQKSADYKKEKQEHLKTIESILREKAKEEGVIQQ